MAGQEPHPFDETAVRERAYEISRTPGAGTPEENWLRAVDELREEHERRTQQAETPGEPSFPHGTAALTHP